MKRRLFIALLMAALMCVGLFAQSVSQIAGTVRDASGLSVPGAEVTATQTATGVVRNTVTSGDGTYSLPSLPIGPYKLEVKKGRLQQLRSERRGAAGGYRSDNRPGPESRFGR